MKPEVLKAPFRWDQRQILVRDQVWYVPDRLDDYSSYVFPGWDHPDFFDCLKPICIEYCSGNGAWIAAKAQAHPDLHWVAVEQNFDRVRKIWSKTKNLLLNNLITVCGEGLRITQHYLPGESVRAIYINFPDPWPKRRHANHRIVKVPFIRELHRILEPGGTLTLVTDDEVYSQQMIAVLRQEPGFHSSFPDPFYVHEVSGYGSSYFEDLWRQKGKVIRYHVFQKDDTKRGVTDGP